MSQRNVASSSQNIPQNPLIMTDDAIETIISRLPIRKLFELSVLSKRFRYSWKFCRDLSFDRGFARNLSRDEFINIVDKIFHSYSSPSADRFHLYFDGDEINVVGHWIRRAVGLGIKILELDFTLSNNKVTLSHDLIDGESIRIMKLVNCELHMPLESNGILRNLTELTFQNARARPMLIKAIFNNCLALRTLQLINCNYVFDLTISALESKRFEKLVVKDCNDLSSIILNAPTLSALHYRGKICKLELQSDLFRLSDVMLDVAHPRGFNIFPHRKDVVISFAFVKVLTVTSIFLEGLSPRFEVYEYKEIEIFFWNLQEFHLFVSPESFINASDIIIFLKKCPHVERIFIDLAQNTFQDSLHWTLHGRDYLSECDLILSFLKCIKVKGFTMKDQSITMARFFSRAQRVYSISSSLKPKILILQKP